MSKKIFDKGFWVAKLFLYQSTVYYFYYSIVKFRSFTFFAATNPAMKMGGMLDDEKSAINDLFIVGLFPETWIYNDTSFFDFNKLKYPVFVKPDIGLKGHNAALIETEEALKAYLIKQKEGRTTLIQEYIGEAKEYSILFVKSAKTDNLYISSLTEKKYPFVIGDGLKSLKQLLDEYDNPFLVKEEVYRRFEDRLSEIVLEDKKIDIEKIGNYSRGAKFYDCNDAISAKMVLELKRVLLDIDGIYFGRFDFKTNSLKDFEQGRWRAIELNGAKSEPLHIYDPKISWFTIVKDIHLHWKQLVSLVDENQKNGFAFPSVRTGLEAKKRIEIFMK